MKHDHKGTKKLKVILFASLMILPLAAVGTTCLITTFNKNTINDETENYKVVDTFYYAVEETKNSPLFTWVENSPLTPAINSFTSVFNIQNDNYITYTLNYWLNITAMYVVIDIIVEGFTHITHIFNKET